MVKYYIHVYMLMYMLLSKKIVSCWRESVYVYTNMLKGRFDDDGKNIETAENVVY